MEFPSPRPRAVNQFDHLVNLRDLALSRGADNLAVRPGQIFRSGELAKASEADLAFVDRLGVKTVIDLRSNDEAVERPHPALDGARYLHLPVVEQSTNTTWIRQAITDGGFDVLTPGLLADANERMIRQHAAVFRSGLAAIMDPANRPVLFHCSAGKDRAGLLSALVLYTLGASDTEVMDDYLESNVRRADVNQETLAFATAVAAERFGIPEADVDASPLAAMLEVRSEYLQRAIAAMVDVAGSVDEFIRSKLGVTDQAIVEFRQQILRADPLTEKA